MWHRSNEGFCLSICFLWVCVCVCVCVCEWVCCLTSPAAGQQATWWLKGWRIILKVKQTKLRLRAFFKDTGRFQRLLLFLIVSLRPASSLFMSGCLLVSGQTNSFACKREHFSHFHLQYHLRIVAPCLKFPCVTFRFRKCTWIFPPLLWKMRNSY